MNREIKFRAWDGYNINYDLYEQHGYNGNIEINDCLAYIDNLMQYTGLLDKNGVEIYEGDILLRKHSIKTKSKGVQNYDSTHIVEWKTHDAFNYDDSNWVGFELPEYLEEHEVIGNIYQNPELVDNSDKK